MATYGVPEEKLTAIADAIRLKTDTAAPMSLDEMALQIGMIESGSTMQGATLQTVDISVGEYKNYNTAADFFSDYPPEIVGNLNSPVFIAVYDFINNTTNNRAGIKVVTCTPTNNGYGTLVSRVGLEGYQTSQYGVNVYEGSTIRISVYCALL